MKYAIVSTGGKQYKVSEGDVLTLEKLPLQANDTYEFPQVLLTVDGEARHIGTPVVSDAAVIAKVLEHTQGKKIRVAKFKAKAKYRRVTGFRADLTKVKIEKIAQSLTGKSEK